MLILSVWGNPPAATFHSDNNHFPYIFTQKPDTPEIDTTGVLPYPFKDQPEFVFPDKKDSSGLFLKRPSNVKTEIQYDPVSGEYTFYEKIGSLNYRLPKSMSADDYLKFDVEQSIKDYWRQQRQIQDLENQGALAPRLTVGGEAFNRIFGGNSIDIKPQGYVEVSFGYQMNTTENYSLPENLRKTPTFDFDQKIQMNVMGKIGEKMQMRVNYNTEATFDYENKMNIDYSGTEDEILKKIEAGNVSLPLNGSLITGGSNLFGVKAEMQFGKLNLTTIFSQNKGETKVVETEGGAQKTTFDIDVADYDANRHFFLSQYFRDHYDQALKNLPIIQSSVTINKIEVWVTNKTSNFQEARNIIAFMDLGEHEPNIYNNIPAFAENSGFPYPENVYPFNDANNLYREITTTYTGIRDAEKINQTLSPLKSYGFTGGNDYEKIEQARKLNESEYTVNLNLGYISLNSALNTDEVLAVAFNYTANGKTYQVGEFSTDGIDAPQTLVLKLIKGTNLSPKLPSWDLMMKNIYNLNAYELTSEDFVLDIVYLNDATGTYVNYLPDTRIQGHILLNVMNLDNLNSQLDPGRDGVFDYIDGITLNSKTARIIFPVAEPFGSHLRDSIGNNQLADKYTFQSLYDSTKTRAEQDAEHNKFRLQGAFKGSSGSEISLSAINISRGSVKVTSGGQTLIENIDYTVDYTLGRVKIINSGLLESGAPIQISTESEDLFSMQRKTMLGAYANYAFSDNFNLGATLLHMQERPLTQKVDYGEDPISNTMVGMDLRYNTQSQLLTTLVDKLPFINTKEISTISVEAEYAQLFPGHSKVITSDGAAYIDDFESTKTAIDMTSPQSWVLASTPQLQPLFPEADLDNELVYGYNRAKLAWYIIDPVLLRPTMNMPDHLKNDKEQLSNHFVREVFQKEIFPDRELPTGIPTNISVLDLAYYPSERGPYNYDSKPTPYSAGVNSDGTLRNPETRWAGIMRKIETTDFETANIEFIEFWMMDPFVYDENGELEGGDLYFNLGEVSEDVLKDSKKSFENGLPTSETVSKVDTTIWGRVPTQQSLVNAFDNNIQSRQYQDVGFDGISDNDEKAFYDNYLQSLSTILDQDAFSKAENDPSSDNFHYFRGSDLDQAETSILERYKNYNGPDGNSPTSEMSKENYATSATSIPDIEDINSDNTLNEYERYYQYKISLRKKDMVVGENYITDKRHASVKLKNGQMGEVDWYQFKIPVREPNQVFGSISDFKSIRFMRMFMHGFQDPTILRFATLDLVRADWRKYERALDDEMETGTGSPTFDISSVNIEENGSKKPVNYILPPDIDRVIDPANTQILQLNEQSLVLKANNIEQGMSKAAYKSIYLDFRTYKRLRMEVHAEEIEGYPLNDDELYLFVRMGSDYNYNYYEYEVPLKLTAPGKYNGDHKADRYAVWPDENRINVALEQFTNAKQARDTELRTAGSGLKITDIYALTDEEWMGGRNTIYVKGRPNLGNVEVMMIGIRNKKGTINTGPKSVEVWVNELRLTDFDEDGGWAANVRVSTRLADLGSVTFAGRTRSAGFGSIDKKVNERALDDLTEIDISSNLELGKFFPEKANVRIPLYIGYSKRVSNPKYNPLDPDVLMEDALKIIENKAEKDSLKQLAQDMATRTSINFTNVKVDKTFSKNKPRIYDPANLSLTYSYNETFIRNVNTEFNINKDHRGLLSYSYNNVPKQIEPFKKISFLKGNAFRLIRDFNFYPMPSQISYRVDLNRHYNEVQLRNITNPNMIIEPTYDKDFLLNNYLDLIYNLTQTLKVDFSSQKTARIDEPEGRINRKDDDYEWKRDSIMTNLLNMGRPTWYHHLFNVSYTLPINKLPGLEWVSASARYTGMYDWSAGALTAPTIELGNTIENSRLAQLNGQVNLISLYDKIKFLKQANEKYGRGTAGSRSLRGRSQRSVAPVKKEETPRFKTVKYNADNVSLKPNVPKSITHKLGTESVQVKFTDSNGQPIDGEVQVNNENRITFTSVREYTNVQVSITGQIEQKESIMLDIARRTSRILMGVRSVSVSYSTTDGTMLPGFLPEPKFLGSGKYVPDANFSNGLGSTTAPGLPFLLGWQDRNFARRAAEKGWITTDSTLNLPYQMTHIENIDFRANIEPIGDLRIDVNANRTYSENTSEFYIYDRDAGLFNGANKTLRGNFTMSVNTWKTAFSKIGSEGVQASEAFQQFKANRITIARRLANRRIPNETEEYDPQVVISGSDFPVGYSQSSQQVLIPSFIAAYTGQDANKVSLDPFPSLRFIRPNWRISYDGMVTQVEGLNKIFKTLSFTHSYRSTYNVGSFITNLDYDETLYEDGFSYVRNTVGDFVSKYDINSVSIIEQLNPLINLDMTFMNDMTLRGEINRTRNLSLSLSNNQLTEVLSNEYSFGVGYRFSKMNLIIKTKRSQKSYSNDLNLRADLAFSKNKTILRPLDEEGQLTAGQNAITIKTTAEYMLSDRFELRFYFDKIINQPFVSTSYTTANTNVGVSFRFTLAQ
jgi:cell surface protein SprA